MTEQTKSPAGSAAGIDLDNIKVRRMFASTFFNGFNKEFALMAADKFVLSERARKLLGIHRLDEKRVYEVAAIPVAEYDALIALARATPQHPDPAIATLRKYWVDGNWNEASTESGHSEISDALTAVIWGDHDREVATPQPSASLPRVFGVSRDAESPGGKGVLVSFHRALTDDELRTLHEALAGRTPQPSADRAPADGAGELVELLQAIRPQFGAVGTRDVDVAAQQKRIDRAIELLRRAPTAGDSATPQPAAPTYWNSQRKMIERAIIGLRDGWATRKDADDALATLAAATPQHSVAEQDKWLPTADNVNALPEPVRRFVHDLATRCDPAGDTAALTGLRDQLDGVQIMYRKAMAALDEVRGCFNAAEVEGLTEVLANTTDERLKDLVERRLMYSLYAAQDPSAQPLVSTAATQPEQAVAWMKPDEIAGLLNSASEDVSARHYGRVYARQYDPDMVPVAALAIPASIAAPVDMILHCPACRTQHIDAPDDRTPDWKNEPHRSHLCHDCGHIWRPADVPTNGVKAIATQGKNDSPAASTAASERRIQHLELLVQAYGPKSLQYDIEHPNDGLNSTDPKEVERTARGTAASEQQAGADERALTDEQIIEALHGQGIDTYPSKYGFDAAQVSATSVPNLRKVIEKCAAVTHRATTATSKDVQTTSKTAADQQDADQQDADQQDAAQAQAGDTIPEQRNISAVGRHSVRSAIVVFRSCRAASAFMKAVRAAMAAPATSGGENG